MEGEKACYKAGSAMRPYTYVLYIKDQKERSNHYQWGFSDGISSYFYFLVFTFSVIKLKMKVKLFPFSVIIYYTVISDNIQLFKTFTSTYQTAKLWMA